MSQFKSLQIKKLSKLLLAKQSKLSLLVFSLMMMFGPIRLYFSLFYYVSIRNNYFDISNQLIINLVVFLFIGALFAVVLAFDYFRYLNNTSEIEFITSLPISKTLYYKVCFLVGFLNVAIVYILAFLINAIMMAFYIQYFSLLPALLSLISIFIIYVVVVFALVNSGTIMDTFTQIALINLLPLIGFFAITHLFTTTIVGWSVVNYYKILWIIVPIFPFVYTLFYIISIPEAVTILNKTTFPYSLNFYYGLWLILGITFFLISLYIYRKRKIEYSNTPLAHSFISSVYLILFTISFQILLTILITPYIILRVDILLLMIIPLAIAAMFYLLVQAIVEKSFVNFTKNLITYLIIGAITLSMMQIFSRTQGFSLMKRDLVVEEVESVKVNYSSSWYSISPIISYSNILTTKSYQNYYAYDYQTELLITQKPDINQLIKLSNDWQEYYSEFYNSSQYYQVTLKESKTNTFDNYSFGNIASSVDLVFNLNDGKSHTKSFYLPTNWLAELVPILMNNLDYATAFSNLEIKNPTYLSFQEREDEYFSTELSVSQAKTLFDKLSHDYREFDVLSTDYKYITTLNFDNGLYVYLTADMHETIHYLQELNVTLPREGITFESDIEYFLLLPNSNSFMHYVLTNNFDIWSAYYSGALDTNQTMQYIKLNKDDLESINNFIIPQGISNTATGLLISFQSFGVNLISPAHFEEVKSLFKDKEIFESSYEDFFAEMIK